MSDADRDEIAKLQALYDENPEGRIFTHLAEAYRKAGEGGRAEEILADGLDRYPDYASAHVVRARVLMDQGRTDEAEESFRRVMELDPNNLIATRALGDLARARGDDDQAVDYYRRVLDQESDESIQEIVDELTADPTTTPPPLPEPEWVESEKVEPADIESEPVGSEPVESEPVESEPVGSEPVGSEPVESEPVESEPVESGPMGSGAVESEDIEVRTETIAQVYARQGLYDRAADVYRELMRARPGDERLEERLAEMEQLAEAQSSGEEVEAVADEDDLDFLGPATTETPPGLELEREGAAEADAMDAGDTGGELVEGFESAALDAQDVDATPLPGMETEEKDPETGLVAGLESELTAEEDLSDEFAVTDVPEPPEETPFEEPAAEETEFEETEFEETEFEETEFEEPAAEEEESVWTGSDWGPDAGADTPHAWADEDDTEPDASPPIRDYLGGLLGWAEDAGAAGAEGTDRGESQRPSAGAGEGAGAGSGGEEADDDLEMFRSWLESLKQ